MDIVSNNLVQWLFLVWYWMIEYWIDIPNLQTVNLPESFEKIQSKSITSICMNMNEWIDVSPKLADLADILRQFTNDDINSNSKSIQIPNGSYNNINSFTLIKLNTIESIEIGDDCFLKVNIFRIDGLNELKSLKIGMKSFTQQKDNWKTIIHDSSRSFGILNCVELKSIEISRYSFSGYSGSFELRNLPKLSTIKIGEIGSESSNFYSCSFVIKG